MSGPDCPVHKIPLEILATTSEFKYYCPRCNTRYNDKLEPR